MYSYLPFNLEGVPAGYKPIIAYARGDNVVVPFNPSKLSDESLHNCDWEGCGSLSHVVRFSIKQKYQEVAEKHGTTPQSTGQSPQICLKCGGEYSVGICKACEHRKGV